MTFDTDGALGVVSKYTTHLIGPVGVRQELSRSVSASDTTGSSRHHDFCQSSIIQHVKPNGTTGAMVLP